jgi:hypothetical protein
MHQPETAAHLDALTGLQVRHGLGIFAHVLTAATVVGSPLLGFLENTEGTKTAGLIVSGLATLGFLITTSLDSAATKLAIALHTKDTA